MINEGKIYYYHHRLSQALRDHSVQKLYTLLCSKAIQVLMLPGENLEKLKVTTKK